MKLGRSVELRVFSKEGEHEEKIREKLLSLLPFNIEDENEEIIETHKLDAPKWEVVADIS